MTSNGAPDVPLSALSEQLKHYASLIPRTKDNAQAVDNFNEKVVKRVLHWFERLGNEPSLDPAYSVYSKLLQRLHKFLCETLNTRASRCVRALGCGVHWGAGVKHVMVRWCSVRCSIGVRG